MDFIKNNVHFTNKYIRENLLKHILAIGIVFVVLGVLSFFVVKVVPEDVLNEMFLGIKEMLSKKDVVNPDGSLSFWGIFFNNLSAGIVICLVGFIPFLFLPVFSVVLNAVIIGAFLAIVSVFSDENIVMAIIKYILPHGVFEIPALITEGAIGSKICTFLSRKIFGKAKGEAFGVHLKGCFRTLVFYVFPLVLIAAFIEAVVLSAIYL